jgi:hypothetical protein
MSVKSLEPYSFSNIETAIVSNYTATHLSTSPSAETSFTSISLIAFNSYSKSPLPAYFSNSPVAESHFRWEVPYPHCTENHIYVFPEMKLRGLVPSAYINVYEQFIYSQDRSAYLAAEQYNSVLKTMKLRRFISGKRKK